MPVFHLRFVIRFLSWMYPFTFLCSSIQTHSIWKEKKHIQGMASTTNATAKMYCFLNQ
uniref:Uncharacterized protein n=1 Tax=Arundo donax TaxID=35708 RepID=A0A0A9BVW2_ARUDO